MIDFKFKKLVAAAVVAVYTLSPVYAGVPLVEDAAEPKVAAVIASDVEPVKPAAKPEEKEAEKKPSTFDKLKDAGGIIVAVGQKWTDPAQNVQEGQKAEEAKSFVDQAIENFKAAKKAYDEEVAKAQAAQQPLKWYQKAWAAVKNFAKPVVTVVVAVVKDIVVPLYKAFTA